MSKHMFVCCFVSTLLALSLLVSSTFVGVENNNEGCFSPICSLITNTLFQKKASETIVTFDELPVDTAVHGSECKGARFSCTDSQDKPLLYCNWWRIPPYFDEQPQRYLKGRAIVGFPAEEANLTISFSKPTAIIGFSIAFGSTNTSFVDGVQVHLETASGKSQSFKLAMLDLGPEQLTQNRFYHSQPPSLPITSMTLTFAKDCPEVFSFDNLIYEQ